MISLILMRTAEILLRDLRLPDFKDYALPVKQPATITGEATKVLGAFLRDVMKLNWKWTLNENTRS